MKFLAENRNSIYRRREEEDAAAAGGGQLAQLAAQQLAELSSQVVNAAVVLAEVPQSKAAAENATLFQVPTYGTYPSTALFKTI